MLYANEVGCVWSKRVFFPILHVELVTFAFFLFDLLDKVIGQDPFLRITLRICTMFQKFLVLFGRSDDFSKSDSGFIVLCWSFWLEVVNAVAFDDF